MISVPDPGLRRALSAAMGALSAQPPTTFASDALASLHDLSWSEEGEAEAYPALWMPIARLDGLEHCTGVTELGLGGNRIQDLRPLAGCVSLEALWLGSNSIVDLAPVARLPHLRRLSVHSNPIVSVVPLQHCPALQILDLGETQVTDFSPLQRVPTLQEVRLGWRHPALDDAQIEVLVALRQRGVRVQLPSDLEARVSAARAQSALAAAEPAAMSAGVVALRARGLDALAAALQREGPAVRDEKGNTLLHQLALLRPGEVGCTGAELAALVPVLVADGVDPHALGGDNHDLPVSLSIFHRSDPAIFSALLAATTDLECPPHRTPLVHALYAVNQRWPGAAESVAALRGRGADITAPAVVVMAARAGESPLVWEALAAGASPHAQAHFYTTFTLLNAVTAHNDLDLMRALLDRGASPTAHHPIGHVRSADALHLLLDRGAILPAQDTHHKAHPLHHIVNDGIYTASDAHLQDALGLVDALVALGQSVDVRSEEGHTVIGQIVNHGAGYSPEQEARTRTFVDHLFAKGANPRARNPQGKSALDCTRVSAARDFVKAHKVGKGETLARQDAKALAKARTWERGTPTWDLLRSVAAREEWALMDDPEAQKARLLALVQAVDHPLTADILASGSLPLAMCWLHDRGHALDPIGSTALHRAVRVEDVERRRRLVLGLIAAGADPAQVQWNSRSPLAEWLYWGAPDDAIFDALAVPGAMEEAFRMIQLRDEGNREDRDRYIRALLARGAPVHREAFVAITTFNEPTHLALAVAHGAEINPGVPGEMESTPLATAIEGSHLASAQWLLENGARPDGNGYTVPLHAARSVAAIRLLVAHGANPHTRRVGFDRNTALHVLAEAARWSFPEEGFDAIEELLTLGLNLRTPNARGETALSALQQSRNPRAQQIIDRFAGA